MYYFSTGYEYRSRYIRGKYFPSESINIISVINLYKSIVNKSVKYHSFRDKGIFKFHSYNKIHLKVLFSVRP